MKFSYNWLNDYFSGKLPEAHKLAEKIGLHSFELESIEKLDNNDFLIDWDILPNRSSDCLCYDGMVKEISTVLNLPAKDVLYRTENIKFDDSFKTSDFIFLDISDTNKSGKEKVIRVTKRLALNVKVDSSPKWLMERLKSTGQKSINNVVDITNYVMWVTGQPVHVFDYDKLSGPENKKNIFIKHAQNGEKIVDLSSNEHKLNNEILVIADNEKYLDIAGIKGGNISGIDKNTTRVLMSVVNFEYENIRNTSRKLKLQTDASKRYENEVPLHKVDLAQKLFGYLLQQLAGAKISKEIIDTKPKIPERKIIEVTLQEINSLLGLNLEIEKVEKIFERLKFNFKTKKQDPEDNNEKISFRCLFEVTPTSERLDINIKEDLIEEVGRIYGYENITEIFPDEGFKIPEKNNLKNAKNKIGDILVSLGFFEVYNRTIVKNGIIKLANSLNSNATYLRNNLLASLQEKTLKNLIHSNKPQLFEIGKIFTKINNHEVLEYYSFAGILGKRKIKAKEEEEIFYETKGVLEKIFEILKVKNIKWESSKDENFVADLQIKKNDLVLKIGKVGINFWEINLEKLVENIDEKVNYKKPSKYPKIARDVAFFVPIDFQVAEAKKIIENILPEEAQDLKLFDIYKDEEKERKSFAFSLTFQSTTQTLSDEFVNKKMKAIYQELEKNNFEIR